MADYHGICRTNYFSVKDAAKFKEFMEACIGDGEVEIFVDKQNDGSIKYGFGCNGDIKGLPYRIVKGEPVATYNLDEIEKVLDYDICWGFLMDALQDILPDGEAVILTEVGNEKLNYLVGCSTVITNADIKVVNIQDKAIDLARQMLGNASYDTIMDY